MPAANKKGRATTRLLRTVCIQETLNPSHQRTRLLGTQPARNMQRKSQQRTKYPDKKYTGHKTTNGAQEQERVFNSLLRTKHSSPVGRPAEGAIEPSGCESHHLLTTSSGFNNPDNLALCPPRKSEVRQTQTHPTIEAAPYVPSIRIKDCAPTETRQTLHRHVTMYN